MDQPIDRLTDWLTNWLTDQPTNRLSERLTDWLMPSDKHNSIMAKATAWFLYCPTSLSPKTFFFVNRSYSNACIMVLWKLSFVLHSFLHWHRWQFAICTLWLLCETWGSFSAHYTSWKASLQSISHYGKYGMFDPQNMCYSYQCKRGFVSLRFVSLPAFQTF